MIQKPDKNKPAQYSPISFEDQKATVIYYLRKYQNETIDDIVTNLTHQGYSRKVISAAISEYVLNDY